MAQVTNLYLSSPVRIWIQTLAGAMPVPNMGQLILPVTWKHSNIKIKNGGAMQQQNKKTECFNSVARLFLIIGMVGMICVTTVFAEPCPPEEPEPENIVDPNLCQTPLTLAGPDMWAPNTTWTASGGVGPYRYQAGFPLVPGTGTSTSAANCGSSQSTITASDRCGKSASKQVQVVRPDSIAGPSSVVVGAVYTVSGGTAPYVWDSGGKFGFTVSADTASMTVTDASGCGTATITVSSGGCQKTLLASMAAGTWVNAGPVYNTYGCTYCASTSSNAILSYEGTTTTRKAKMPCITASNRLLKLSNMPQNAVPLNTNYCIGQPSGRLLWGYYVKGAFLWPNGYACFSQSNRDRFGANNFAVLGDGNWYELTGSGGWESLQDNWCHDSDLYAAVTVYDGTMEEFKYQDQEWWCNATTK